MIPKNSNYLVRTMDFQIARRSVMRGALVGAGGLIVNSFDQAFGASVSSQNEVIAETGSGKLRGISNNGITSFKGIPYGDSTTGPNRFLPPVKPTSWKGIRDALEFGSMSPQPGGQLDPKFQEVIGYSDIAKQGEDCLVLNVWTPSVGTHEKRPVMFWCHGGGFSSGSGSQPVYNGEHLARAGDVVVITVNHRLGPLGYLYLGGIGGERFVDSGNAGMLDLVQALKWVRSNVSNFGGDPHNVTIFGQSGGGSKVSTLLAMPVAKDLFHKAVIESGPGIRMVAREDADQLSRMILKELELKPEQLDQLQNMSTDRILAASAAISARRGSGGSILQNGFAPVVDGHALPTNPFDPVAPAVSGDVPLLIGSTKDESTLFLAFAPPDPNFGNITDDELKRRVTPMFGDKTDHMIEVYRKARPDAAPWDIFVGMRSDPTQMDSIAIAERKIALKRGPVFMYLFAWESPVAEGALKSFHALEVPLVFQNTDIAPTWTGNSPLAKPLAEKMSAAWIAFARHGDPNVPSLPHWPVYDLENRSTMVFDNKNEVVNDPHHEERLAWKAVDP